MQHSQSTASIDSSNQKIGQLPSWVRWAFLFGAAAVVAVFLNTAQAQVAQLTIEAGESRTIDTDYVISRISVGDPDVMEVIRVSDQQVLLNAKGDGTTNVLIWEGDTLKEEYRVRVGPLRNAGALANELTILLEDIDGVTVRIAGNRVVVEGEVHTRAEADQIEKVTADADDVINLVVTSDLYNRLLADEIKSTIGLDGIQVRYTGNGYVLEGVVNSDDEVAFAENIAASFGVPVINAMMVAVEEEARTPVDTDLVQLDIRIIEINVDQLADFSNDYTIGGDILSTLSTEDDESSAVGTLNLTDPNLRKLQEKGKGRVLVEHSMVTRYDSSAQTFIGDEIPLLVLQDDGQTTVEYKQVGIALEFSPTRAGENMLSLQLKMNSTSLTGETIGGTPILSSVNVNTALLVRDRDNIVLSGLIRQREVDSYFGSGGRSATVDRSTKEVDTGSGTKGRSQITQVATEDPNRYADERSEALVIVRPVVVKSHSNAGKRLKNAVERSYKDYELSRYKDFQFK